MLGQLQCNRNSEERLKLLSLLKHRTLMHTPLVLNPASKYCGVRLNGASYAVLGHLQSVELCMLLQA